MALPLKLSRQPAAWNVSDLSSNRCQANSNAGGVDSWASVPAPVARGEREVPRCAHGDADTVRDASLAAASDNIETSVR